LKKRKDVVEERGGEGFDVGRKDDATINFLSVCVFHYMLMKEVIWMFDDIACC